MKKIKFVQLFALSLAVLLSLSLASCSGKKGEGDMSEKSSVSKSGQENTVEKKEDYEFARGYYNWLYADAFKDFSSAIKVTKLPGDLESALSSLSIEKKISVLREIFCSKDVVAAVQTASEYESGKKEYTHKVVSVSKNQKGVYDMVLKVSAGQTEVEKTFELMLSESTRAISLVRYDEDGNTLEHHKIVVTNDGYIAVSKAALSNNTWTSMQLLFKGGEKPEGYCKTESNLKDEPAQIYPNSVYEGFAGKQ